LITFYEESNLILFVIQQSGSIVSDRRQEFVHELLASFKNEQWRKTIILTVFNAVKRDESHITRWEWEYW